MPQRWRGWRVARLCVGGRGDAPGTIRTQIEVMRSCCVVFEFRFLRVVVVGQRAGRTEPPRSRLTRLGTPGAQDATAGGGV